MHMRSSQRPSTVQHRRSEEADTRGRSLQTQLRGLSFDEGAALMAPPNDAVQMKGGAPPEDIPQAMTYEALMEVFEDPHGERRVLIDGKAEIIENGGLFVEAINLAAEEAYTKKISGPGTNGQATSEDEKLHVPASADDVSQRWSIVSSLCMARGVVNWKVAKSQPLGHKISGTENTFALLSGAGLLDTQEHDPGKQASDYIAEAMKPERRATLLAFLARDPRASPLDSDIVQDLIARCESTVLDQGAFPKEQEGREITIYIKPRLKENAKDWSAFVSELHALFMSSGLPMLPIAVGDQEVAGGGVMKDGVMHGYFSYRNEAQATDEQLGYRGFPHWLGSNADKPNAAEQPMQLDQAKVVYKKPGMMQRLLQRMKPKKKAK